MQICFLVYDIFFLLEQTMRNCIFRLGSVFRFPIVPCSVVFKAQPSKLKYQQNSKQSAQKKNKKPANKRIKKGMRGVLRSCIGKIADSRILRIGGRGKKRAEYAKNNTDNNKMRLYHFAGSEPPLTFPSRFVAALRLVLVTVPALVGLMLVLGLVFASIFLLDLDDHRYGPSSHHRSDSKKDPNLLANFNPLGRAVFHQVDRGNGVKKEAEEDGLDHANQLSSSTRNDRFSLGYQGIHCHERHAFHESSFRKNCLLVDKEESTCSSSDANRTHLHSSLEEEETTFRLSDFWCNLVFGGGATRKASGLPVDTSSNVADDEEALHAKGGGEQALKSPESVQKSVGCGYFAGGSFGAYPTGTPHKTTSNNESRGLGVPIPVRSFRDPTPISAGSRPFDLSETSLRGLYASMRQAMLRNANAVGGRDEPTTKKALPYCATSVPFGSAIHPSTIGFEGSGGTTVLRSLQCPFEYVPYGAPIAAVLHHHASPPPPSRNQNNRRRNKERGMGRRRNKDEDKKRRRRGIVFSGDSMTRHLFSHIIMSLRGFDKYGDRHFHEDALYLVYPTHDEHHVLSSGAVSNNKRLRAILSYWFEGYVSRHPIDRVPPRRRYGGFAKKTLKRNTAKNESVYEGKLAVVVIENGRKENIITGNEEETEEADESEASLAAEARAPLFALLFLWDVYPEDPESYWRHTNFTQLSLTVGGYHYWPISGADGARVFQEQMDRHLMRNAGERYILSTVPWLKTIPESERLERNNVNLRWVLGNKDFHTRQPVVHGKRTNRGKDMRQTSDQNVQLSTSSSKGNLEKDLESAVTSLHSLSGIPRIILNSSTNRSEDVKGTYSDVHPDREIDNEGSETQTVQKGGLPPSSLFQAAYVAGEISYLSIDTEKRKEDGQSGFEAGDDLTAATTAAQHQKYVLDFAAIADTNREFGMPIKKSIDEVHYKCALTTDTYLRAIINVTENGMECRDPMNEALMQWLIQLMLRL